MSESKIILVVPSLNAASSAASFLQALRLQTLQPHALHVIDSHSTDETREIFESSGAHVHQVGPSGFNHGGTRQSAVEKYAHDAEIVAFMTQDAILADEASLQNLVNAFHDESVSAAYGRQLPRQGANPIEAHARVFNYPAESQLKSLDEKTKLGVKTCFISNSFAAYRSSALQQIDGFPENNIVSEDTYVAAKMLEAGWKIKYCADARVYHSHNYSMTQEFQRYFDLGVFHSREPWIRKLFGQAEGEGRKFVLSQLAFLMNGRAFLIPSALLRTVFKYLGFRLGFCEAYLPNRVKIWLSMQKYFWL